MQCSPYEIKDKLLKALDEDNNVVDMAAVIEVIGMLERTPITKDALERTRLGRYINELRKKTSNEQLARRAKDLVKSWRRLLPCGAPAERTGTPNGAPTPPVTLGPGPGPGVGPGPGPGLGPIVASKLLSPALRPARLAGVVAPRSISPSCSSVSNSPVPPAALAAATTAAPPRTRNGGFKPVSPACRSAPTSPGSPLAHPYPRSPTTGLEPVAKNNVANKRLRKSADRDGLKKAATTATASGASSGVPWTPPNGVHATAAATAAAVWDASIPSGNSAFESVRRSQCTTSVTSPRVMPKVKTTQQLIADLRAKSGANVSLDGVVVPPTLSPPTPAATRHAASRRPLKRAGNYSLLGTDDETSRTKSELMDRFLQSSAREPPNGPVSREIASILSALPDLSSFGNLEEEEEEEDAPRPPMEVTPAVEERFATERWEFVNGVYDHGGAWRGWEEVTTAESLGGDVLHILPYVNTDW
ncbi:mediator of RNA polymerase II transcription subunit 26-like [Ixodes scapularis]|uniref:mediator of RNA polymerase II transcription subunit 26-like n=1 Tax=Ixodes scapularis TaxID=6945 RepID=UPI001A9FD3D1|nr:mediator of RNA polymerase II transcription subunit 26-like [Ixodes scapularis]